MQKTLVILKPDAVKRGITGKIIERLESKGLKLVASKMQLLDESILKEHYSHLATKPFFPSIVEYMTSAPVILQIWEGVYSCEVVRLMLGATNARTALPGTIRGDFAMSISKNTMHASESLEAANIEISRFFKQEEVFSYVRSDEEQVYDKDDLR
ncbi:MAG: nucleoside-diphosphate kinase [Candidatus Absconditabacteria bacterium]